MLDMLHRHERHQNEESEECSQDIRPPKLCNLQGTKAPLLRSPQNTQDEIPPLIHGRQLMLLYPLSRPSVDLSGKKLHVVIGAWFWSYRNSYLSHKQLQ